MGAVNEGHVVSLALCGRFAGDPRQAIETRPCPLRVPMGNGSLRVHQDHFVDAELRGHADAIVELRAFRNTLYCPLDLRR